ncbi:MAG: DUF2892 domain-containing protein [Tunicatimonas sp.]
MKKNMGMTDRIIRITVAVAVGVLILTGTISGVWAIVLGGIAGVFLLTSFVSFCPLYRIFGMNTCSTAN